MAKRAKAPSVEVLSKADTLSDSEIVQYALSLAVRSTPGGPPDDPSFFKAIRLTPGGVFDKPYAQHPWVYAGINSAATPIAQLNFQLYRTEKNARLFQQDAWDAKAREAALGKIREVAPRLRRSVALTVATQPTVKGRLRSLRRVAPWLTPDELVRASSNNSTPHDVEEVNEGPWQTLFQQPNPNMIGSQLWEMTIIMLGEEGECFWILLGKSGSPVGPGEIPDEAFTSRASEWKAGKKKDGTLKAWLREEGPTQKAVPYETHQVVHNFYPNPHDQLRGLSPIKPIQVEVEADYRAAQYNLAFLNNGGLPAGWFTTDSRITPEQAREFVRDIEARHATAKKAGRFGVLSHGWKFQASDTTHRDMQYATLRNNARDLILSAGYRTTKAMVGLASDHNRSTAEVAVRNHWDTVVLPKVHMLEDTLDAQLFTLPRARTLGYDVFGLFDLSTVPALKENLTDQLANAKELQALGWSLNQINEALELNLPELPPEIGDISYVSNLLTEVGGEEEEPEPAPVPPPAPGAPVPPPPSNDEPTAPPGKDKGLRSISLKTRDHEKHVFSEVIVPGTRELRKMLKLFLYELRREQLKLGRTPFDLKHWKEELRKASEPTYRRVVKLAADDAEAELAKLQKAVRGAAGVAVVRAADAQVFTLASGLSARIGRILGTMRGALEKILGAAQAGASDAAISALIKATFNKWMTGSKVSFIAENEAAAATNQARDAVFAGNSVAEEEWLTAEDELVRENHQIYGDQEPQPSGTNWATFAGESYKLLFPHDPQAPGDEVCGCRCIVVPVIR